MSAYIRKIIALMLVAGVGLTPAPVLALETSLQYVLTLSGDIERKQVRYQCDGRDGFLQVEYVNAFPNYLAILTLDEDGPRVFVNVVSASGARYVSGLHEWWTKGSEANLRDLGSNNSDGPVLTCLEYNDIP